MPVTCRGEQDMKNMQIYNTSLSFSLETGPDILDITAELDGVLRASGIKAGMLGVTVVGSTGSVTTIEYEPGVVQDLKDAIARLAPPDAFYRHELAWHDGNGHSHVQAALIGPSVSVGVRDGRLSLGTWQQVVLINHDNRPRKRRVDITVTGLA